MALSHRSVLFLVDRWTPSVLFLEGRWLPWTPSALFLVDLSHLSVPFPADL
jgi:hypothetical protein